MIDLTQAPSAAPEPGVEVPMPAPSELIRRAFQDEGGDLTFRSFGLTNGSEVPVDGFTTCTQFLPI